MSHRRHHGHAHTGHAGHPAPPKRTGRALADDGAAAPDALPQFKHVGRSWDRDHGKFAARLLPGEYYVTTAGEIVTTVLGSCVSACIRDTRLGYGGMNHFMLPRDASSGTSAWGTAVSAATRYGNVAMEHLINDILKVGGRRENLEVKLVGGGKVLGNMTTDIGARNIEFVRRYVFDEGFTVAGEDLGGIHPRRVLYFPETGLIRVRKLTTTPDQRLIERERQYMLDLAKAKVDNDVELF
jgi:chemotaxis protein CheD